MHSPLIRQQALKAARSEQMQRPHIAPDRPESSVKRSRLQSHEAPRRRSCCVMKPPYCAFQAHTCGGQ